MTTEKQQPGAYYLNSLRSWQTTLMREMPLYEARLATLREIGHPNAADHEALIAVRCRMLKVVEDAILAVVAPSPPAEKETPA